MGQARGQGGLKTEVAGQFQQDKAGIERGAGADERGGTVPAAVIHQQSAPADFGLAVEQGAQALEKLRQHGLFVEHGDDDRYFGSGGRHEIG